MKLSYYGKASKNVWVNFFTFQLLKCLEITRQYSKVWVNLLNSSEMQFYNLAAKIQRDLQMTNSKGFCDMSQRIPVKKIRLLYQDEFRHLSFGKTIIISICHQLGVLETIAIKRRKLFMLIAWISWLGCFWTGHNKSYTFQEFLRLF